jgi:hypothetical protein
MLHHYLVQSATIGSVLQLQHLIGAGIPWFNNFFRDNQKLAGRRVTVIDYPDGRIKIRYEGRDLEYREFDKLTHTHQGEAEAIATREAQRSVPYPSLPCPRQAHLEKITSLCFDSE